MPEEGRSGGALIRAIDPSPAPDPSGQLLQRLVAFGERHPQRPATRSVSSAPTAVCTATTRLPRAVLLVPDIGRALHENQGLERRSPMSDRQGREGGSDFPCATRGMLVVPRG